MHKKQNENRRGFNRLRTFQVFLGVVIVVLLVITHWHHQETSPGNMPHRHLSKQEIRKGQTERLIALIKRNTRWKEQLVKAFESVAAGDETGDLLIAFHREHASHSVLIGRGLTAGLPVDNPREMLEDPLGFEVTIASREERVENQLRAYEQFQFDADRNELFAPPPDGYSESWFGFAFAHELSHAHDLVTGFEPRELPAGDRRFIESELRAYGLELRLIDNFTGGAFERTAERIVSDDNRDVPTSLNVGTRTDDEFQELDALFPPAVSEDEKSTRGGLSIIALNFALIDRYGLGGTEAKIRFIRHLYEDVYR